MARDDLPDGVWSVVADHTKLYLSEPEKAHLWDTSRSGRKDAGLTRTLLLTTKGRKTGKVFHSPLTYVTTGESYVVIGSNGGARVHPDWYKNLLADPEVEIQVGPSHFYAQARTAIGEERARLWAQLCGVYPRYANYQATAGDREIPLIVLVPKTS